MEKYKWIKIIILGNLIINAPIALGLYYMYTTNNYSVNVNQFLIIGVLGFGYWSVLSPIYRMYSIKKITSIAEYYLWKKWSIYACLLWPDSFILSKFEYWNDQKREEYHQIKNSLLENYK